MAVPRRSPALRMSVFVRLLLTLVAGAGVMIGVTGCAASSGVTQAVDRDAAKQVQEYFAGSGARYVEGLAVRNIEVTDEIGGRRLSLTFVSDGSGGAATSLSSLYYMSTAEDGWVAELNKSGLSVAWVRMEFDYPDGTSPETLDVNVTARSVAGSTRLRPGPATTRP